MVQGDDPAALDLAHEAGVDAVLRVLRAVQGVAADQLGGVGSEHLDFDVEEAELPALVGRAAVVADVMVERALPAVLEAALRDEDRAGFRRPSM